MSDEQLLSLDKIVTPLVKQGHSFEAICFTHEEVGVCARTLYNYQDKGLLSTANIELPRKVRLKPRKKTATQVAIAWTAQAAPTMIFGIAPRGAGAGCARGFRVRL